MYNKEFLRKELEDCWDASWVAAGRYQETDTSKITKQTFITTRLAALDDGDDERIYSIIDAYSMQPAQHSVMTEEFASTYYDKPRACKEIKLEQVIVGDNPSTADVKMMYVGYNFEGKKIFQYLADSVNVHYGNPI